MNQNNELNDEIDLRDLFFTLWGGKIYIILILIISVFLASFYLQFAERKYSVEYNLKPVGETENSPNFAGLGGLASLTGIQLPTSSGNDFSIFKELITAPEVSEIIFENSKIIRDIVRSEWDETLNNFSRPPKSKSQIFVSDAKKLLTGNKEVNYIHPNPRRLAIFINNNIKDNNPITSINWYDAVKFCNWLSKKDGFEEVYLFKNKKYIGINKGANGYRLPTESEWAWVARYANKDSKNIEHYCRNFR